MIGGAEVAQARSFSRAVLSSGVSLTSGPILMAALMSSKRGREARAKGLGRQGMPCGFGATGAAITGAGAAFLIGAAATGVGALFSGLFLKSG